MHLIVITVNYSHQRTTAVPDITLLTENACRIIQYTKYIYVIDWRTVPHTHYKKVPTQKNKNKESGQFNVRTNNYACVQKLITLSITINNKSYNNYT